MTGDQVTDEDLLTSGEPADFGRFYQRRVPLPLPEDANLVVSGGGVWVTPQPPPARPHVVGRWRSAASRSMPRWPAARCDASSTNSLVADGAGVWLLSPTRAAIMRIQAGRVVKGLPVDASAQPVLAKARDGLWIATADRLGGHHRLIRIDPASGKPTATLELGRERPVALIPTDDQLYVPTADGKILFVEP